jgi:hypothetical protein
MEIQKVPHVPYRTLLRKELEFDQKFSPQVCKISDSYLYNIHNMTLKVNKI